MYGRYKRAHQRSALGRGEAQSSCLFRAPTRSVTVLGRNICRAEGDLNRPKFDGYLREGDRASYLALIQDTSRFIEITESIEKSRDSDDDKFLELALSGNADVIVSGDDDLLVLHPFRGIPILSPDAFLESEFVEP